MNADQVGRLKDIVDAARLIESYLADSAPEDFYGDVEKQDAVLRRLEIIGEAVSRLKTETRAELPSLPFRSIRGMRNILVHDYANVDLQIVWEVATVYVPMTRRTIEDYFVSRGIEL